MLSFNLGPAIHPQCWSENTSPQAVTHRSKGRKEETSTSRSYHAGPAARSKFFNRSTNNTVVMLVVSPWYVDEVVHV